MNNIRKGQCCWNCKYVSILLEYDSTYEIRCCYNVGGQDDYPKDLETPSLSNLATEEIKKQKFKEHLDEVTKKLQKQTEWRNIRPERKYGDVCDNFEMKE